MREDVRFCTTDDCNRLTTLYLCTTCIVELAELLDDVSPILQLMDGAFYGTSVTRNPGAGGGGVASSKPAMNIDAFLLRAWLNQLPASAHAEAMDNPTAGRTLYMAREWIAAGRDLVWGPEDKRVYGRCGLMDEPDPDVDEYEPQQCAGQLVAHPDDATVKCPDCHAVHQVAEIIEDLRQKARGQPMAPRDVREFLQKKARVFILKKDFENWVSRGKLGYVLDRVTTVGKAQRLYYPGDVLEISEDMRDWGRRGFGIKV